MIGTVVAIIYLLIILRMIFECAHFNTDMSEIHSYYEGLARAWKQKIVEEKIAAAEKQTMEELEFWIAHYLSIYSSCTEIVYSSTDYIEADNAWTEALSCSRCLSVIYPLWGRI